MGRFLGEMATCRQPDSGKPTVRDERGAEQKHELWRDCDPAAQIERVRVGNPLPKVACVFFWVRLLPELTIYHAYHLRNGMFGHDGAYGTDLSVNPKTGMVAIFMVQCSGGDQWAARELFLKTATRIFPK